MTKAELREYFIRKLGFDKGYQSKNIFEFLITASEVSKDGVILDAGAARQRYKPFFETSIYLTQEHDAGIQLKNMRHVKYDFINPIDEKIPLKDNCLDAVLSTSVIEHLRYPYNFILEAYRVLKPGGRLFINVPFVHPEHETPFDFNRTTRFGLERWFKDAGFNEYIIQPSSSCTETICHMLPFAFRNDILRSTKCCSQILEDLLRCNDVYGIIRKMPRFFFSKLVWLLSRAYCRLVRLLLDRGPHIGTNFPVGWVAIATKQGVLKKPFFKDKEDFLNQNRL